ncbi:hypothetical_protein_-_conserved [Leishmania major strain Friedlin]|nr:hypothetical_protein_-_conserved [Leishmania major strain Friedlin]
MPVVDVSVLCATEITGVSLRYSFCVYVRLQGQAIRTKSSSADHVGEVRFGERFRFQYDYDTRRPSRNRLFVELWTKRLFSQSCVSVAWIEMGEQRFVRGEQTRMNVRGAFEGKRATLSIAITPLDFGESRCVVQQQMPVLYGVPVEGIPLASPNPYTSAAYVPNACATAQDSTACENREVPTQPPQPQACVGASLPPPLYPSLSQGMQHQPSGGGQCCGTVSTPSQIAERDHSVDCGKPKQL